MNTRPRVTALSLTIADTANTRRESLRAAIARLGGYCDWCVDSSGWVVTLYLPQERVFAGPTLEAALSACMEWLTSATVPSSSVGLLHHLAARGMLSEKESV